MAALSHTRKDNGPVAGFGSAADALAKLSQGVMSREAAKRHIEEAFMERLLSVLMLTPHDLHDLAVSGKLGKLFSTSEDTDARVERMKFKDLKPYRPGSGRNP